MNMGDCVKCTSSYEACERKIKEGGGPCCSNHSHPEIDRDKS